MAPISWFTLPALLFFPALLPLFSVTATSATIFPSVVRDTLSEYRYLPLCAGEIFAGRVFPRDTFIDLFFPGEAEAPDTLRTFEIDILPPPLIILSGDTSLCAGESTAMLKVEGIFTSYRWSTGAEEREIQVSGPGRYTVSVTASTGCKASRTVEVTTSFPDAILDQTAPSCAGQTDGEIRLSGFFGGKAPYETSLNGGPFQVDSIFTGLAAGDYRLQWRDAAGCIDSMEVKLQEPPPFSVEIGPDELIFPGDTLRLQAIASSPIQRWLWEPADLLDCSDCPAPLVLRPRDATLTLSAWNQNGCLATDSKDLKFQDSLNLYVPNVFAPYRGTVNTTLRIFPGPGVGQLTEFLVYDRWGGQMFRAASPIRFPDSLEWDGRARGELAPPGVYLWRARLELPNGKIQVRSGSVTVF